MTTNWCPHPDGTKACGKCVAELVISEERKAFYAIVDHAYKVGPIQNSHKEGWESAFVTLRAVMSQRLLGGK